MVQEVKKRNQSIIFWCLAVLTALAFALWRIAMIVPGRWHTDEGAFVTSAFWLSKGYDLYSQISIYAYPFMLEFLAWVFRWFSPSLYAARVAIVILGVMYLLLTGLTARSLSSNLGAVICMAVLFLDRDLFDLSGWALAEVPALLMASVTVMLAFISLRSMKRPYLYAAGLMCGVGFLVKPLAFPLILWVWLVSITLTFRSGNLKSFLAWRQIIRDSLLLAVFFLAPFLISMLLYDREAFIQYVFLTPMALRKAMVWQPIANWDKIADYLLNNPLATFASLAGLTVFVFKRDKELVNAMITWALLVLLLLGLLWHTPLAAKHCVILSLPLSILAAISADQAIRIVKQSNHTGYRIFYSIVLFGVVVFAVLGTASLAERNDISDKYKQGGHEDLAKQVLAQITAPGEIIISDDMGLAVTTNRLLPPELGDMAFAQITAGNITDENVLAAAQKYDVQTIVLWSLRLEWLKGFVDWANESFAGSIRIDEHRVILHGRRYTSPKQISSFQAAPNILGDTIALAGYSLDADRLMTGSQERLTLYWEALKPVDKEYQVFVHLIDPQGKLVSQADSPPINGLYPTTAWYPGEILADVHALHIPLDIEPGSYRIWVGMYELDSLERLSVFDPESGAARGDFVELVQFEINTRTGGQSGNSVGIGP